MTKDEALKTIIREMTNENGTITLNRFKGAMLGLAAGDAVGTTVEFTVPGTFLPIDDMIGGGPFYLNPGEWTDDTSMALCMAESLVIRRGFRPADIMRRFIRWRDEGYLSSTGRCFDIGNTTTQALDRFLDSGNPYAGLTAATQAGNGSLMRLAPVALAYANDPDKAIDIAGLSSQLTHGAKAAVDACRYYAGLMVGALNGATKQELLSVLYHPTAGQWDIGALDYNVAIIACDPGRVSNPVGGGYVIDAMEAALWAFRYSDTFEEGCLMAANLGGDADTTAAIYGQLAGAYYGAFGIPSSWRYMLAMSNLIELYATELYNLNESR